MPRPLLDPPCKGWCRDLPGPDKQPGALVALAWTPHHLDTVYLELSRPPAPAGGLGLCCMSLALFCFAVSLTLLGWPWSYVAGEGRVLLLSTLMLSAWAGLCCYRAIVCVPRGLPIRFNRARRRIYTYNVQRRRWNPFRRWLVTPVAYDWTQVRAEAWRQCAPLFQGGIVVNWGVSLAIVAPGTHTVIDRFMLCSNDSNEAAWACICTYMQQGAHALPPPGPSRAQDEAPWYDLAWRLTPQVRWPQDMDRESRTAP